MMSSPKWYSFDTVAHSGDKSWMASLRRISFFMTLAMMGLGFASIPTIAILRFQGIVWKGDQRVLAGFFLLMILASCLRLMSSYPSHGNPYFSIEDKLSRDSDARRMQRANAIFPWALLCMMLSVMFLSMTMFIQPTPSWPAAAVCFAGVLFSFPGSLYSIRYAATSLKPLEKAGSQQSA